MTCRIEKLVHIPTRSMSATTATSQEDSMSGLLVATIINFFHLQNTVFFWEYLLNNRVYMRHLAFLGDAVLKTYVVHELMRRGGICCPSLFSRTTSYITNKNLSIVFEKLSFQAAISWTFPKLYPSKPPGIKFMGTVIESMLGSTFLHCSEHTQYRLASPNMLKNHETICYLWSALIYIRGLVPISSWGGTRH